MATIIGTRTTAWSGTETAYRLSVPLNDCYPPWRNVVVQERPNGERHVMRCKGYERADGSWAAIPPQQGSWIACCNPLTTRDLALVESEVALIGWTEVDTSI